MSVLHFHSPPRANHSSSRALFELLSDFRNFPQILPMERISEFKAEQGTCTFNIQGIAALHVNIESASPFKEIMYRITGPAKSELKLLMKLTGDEGKGTNELELAAHLNPFLKVMAEKPLKTLVATIAEKVAELNINDPHEN